MIRPHEVYDAHPQHPLALDHEEGVVYDALVAQETGIVNESLDRCVIDLRLEDVRPSVFVDGEVGV